MGIVYEGRDPNLDRHVAIKTVKVENLSKEAASEYEARFRTEARSAARLQHPHIVSVYDSDRDGDIAFLVMEYIQGDDLKHHLDKGVRYSLEQSLKMVRDLLSALDYAHRQGIVHRDIKPANLLIEPGGRVKLTDFGVARMQDSGDATRTQGTMVGTLKYMSPEQVQGQKIDSRADLFSVGVVLYQLLTDKRPFDGENDFSIIHQIIGHTPPPPSSFNARLPPEIDAVVARALAKDREQRFATARDFAAALQSAMRRAEDATVVPPADPSRKTGAGGSTGGGVRSLTGPVTLPSAGSTISQEVELVYWKDIKDSGEPEELQDFLNKFPAGIYGDLARRRLRKLSSGMVFDSTLPVTEKEDPEASDLLQAPDDPPQERPDTLPAGAAAQPAVTAMSVGTVAPAPVAVRVAPDVTVPLAIPVAPVQARPAAAAAQTAADSESAFPSTILEADDETSPGAAAAVASGSDDAGAASGHAADAALAPPARRKPVVAVLVAVGALAVAGIAALMMMGQGDGEKPLAGPAGAVSATVTVAPAALHAGPGEAVTPATAVPANAARPLAAASAARRPLSAARNRLGASAPASHPDRSYAAAPMPAPAPVRESRDEPRPAAIPAPTAVRGSPVDACRDMNFVMREFCLAEQCDKPGTRNHPLCVKRREDAKLREDSKVRN